MYNYVYNEEFELKNGVYVSRSRVMGKNFQVIREGIGKGIAELVLKRGEKWLFEYFGANPENEMISIGEENIKVRRYRPIYIFHVGDTILNGEAWMFREHATAVEREYWNSTLLKYREVREKFELRIDGIPAGYFSGELFVHLRGGNAEKYFRNFFEYSGYLKITLKNVWGKWVTGELEYESDKKEFTSGFKINPKEGAVILTEASFLEGVYWMKATAGKKINLDAMFAMNAGKGVKKKVVYGVGARRVNIEVKKIIDNHLIGDDFEIEYGEDGFWVYYSNTKKYFDYDDWELVQEFIKNGGVHMLELAG